MMTGYIKLNIRQMKVRDLKKKLSELDDDFEVQFVKQIPISEKQLKTMSYPYPYANKDLHLDDMDIGHSDKKIKFILVEK